MTLNSHESRSNGRADPVSPLPSTAPTSSSSDSQNRFSGAPADRVEQLLARDLTQRSREARYRVGQSLVFGLPVLALAVWGRGLGGGEAARWVGVFQALLAGWVVYVGAAGMIAEGILLLAHRRRLTADFCVGAAAATLYALGIVQLGRNLLDDRPHRMPFALPVVMIGAWAAWQWWRISRAMRRDGRID